MNLSAGYRWAEGRNKKRAQLGYTPDWTRLRWSLGESNPRPFHCERNALPTELKPRAHEITRDDHVGQLNALQGRNTKDADRCSAILSACSHGPLFDDLVGSLPFGAATLPLHNSHHIHEIRDQTNVVWDHLQNLPVVG